MKIKDSFFYAIRNLQTSSLRSWLTIIGVVIGVIALVAITSVSEGVQKTVYDELAAFGPNMMIVVPVNMDKMNIQGAMSSVGRPATSGKLFERDAAAIAGIPGVKSVARMNMGRTSVSFLDVALTSPIYGSDASYYDQYKGYLKLESGRMFKDGERRVVVLGNDAANKMFGKRKVDVGNVIKINDQDYRVIGIFEKIGSSFSQSDDSSIIIPYEDGKTMFASQLSKNEVVFISVEAVDASFVPEIKDEIEHKLASYHKVTLDNKDFSIITSDFINETIGGILGTLSAFLVLITLVASVVGAIGVANTMFMGVLERTREIGILKAIGATEKDIMSIFLVESAIIGIIGGIIGLVLAAVLLYIAGSFGVPYQLSLWIIAFAFFFSAAVGIAAGYIPARRAARLDAVDALKG